MFAARFDGRQVVIKTLRMSSTCAAANIPVSKFDARRRDLSVISFGITDFGRAGDPVFITIAVAYTRNVDFSNRNAAPRECLESFVNGPARSDRLGSNQAAAVDSRRSSTLSTNPYCLASAPLMKRSRSVSFSIFSRDCPVCLDRILLSRSLTRRISLA